MTEAQALVSCWGAPRHAVRRTTAAGAEVSYFYHGGIVKIVDGKVSEVIETADLETEILKHFKK